MTNLTKNAASFIKANKESKVVIGSLLDKDKKDVRHPKDTAYTRYTLENGQVFDLTTEDSFSMKGVTPDWDLK